MRSKAPLALIELSVMLLVLCVAAALCLHAFLWAQETALENTRRDTAMAHIQSAAEVLKHCGGDFEAASKQHGGSWDGAAWVIREDGYTVRAVPEDTDSKYLGKAALEVMWEEEILTSLQVCWQEVPYGQ